MKILLLRPPRRDSRDASLPVPPLGLTYIAAELLALGHEVELLDAVGLGIGWDELEGELRVRGPQLVGVGAMTPTADIAYRAATIAKGVARWVVLGGPHPTATGSEALEQCAAIDHLVVGEGEEVVGPYVEWLLSGAEGAPPPGVMARRAPFVEATISRPIGEIRPPARQLLEGASYHYLMATRPGFATMITSRGCPFRCSFCDKSVSGSRWRARSAGDVVDELEGLAASGVGFVNIYDDNFTLRRSRVVEICEEIIERGVDIEWKCEGRVDGVDLPLLRLMARAGCRVIAYGVESANRESLARLRKDMTVEEVIEAFCATREAGIRTMAYAILGIPGEGVDEVRRTARFVREIGADYVQFSTLSAMPGTDLETMGAAVDVSGPLDSDLSRPTVTDLPPEELSQLMREAWWGFYLRPAPMVRVAADAWASGALGELARMALRLTSYQVSSRIR